MVMYQTIYFQRRWPASTVVNHLSSTLRTLLNITWQWKLLPTNGHRLLLRSSSAINFAPQGFSKFFPIFHENFDFTHTPRGCLWHGISEHASCGIIFCGGVRNCIFGLLYSCHNVVAKQFQCVPFYQSQLQIRQKSQILNLSLEAHVSCLIELSSHNI